MKFIIDMNLSPQWAEVLGANGYNGTVHWSSVGPATASDSEILGYAAANGYAVLSHDLDMSAIIAATRALGPSVVQFRMDDILPANSAHRVMAVLRQFEDGLKRGAIITIDEHRSRVRILPISE
ncbi:MAG: hypothetical protein AMXMBFR84_08290 [Candidatus Hydrogenedentota bacterium]